MFIPSPQQTAVLEWIETGQWLESKFNSAFVEAVAGAGKTTTLVEALRRTHGSVAFAAYNKKIADEIKTRVGEIAREEGPDFAKRVKVGTFHSFGLNAWRFVHKGVQVDDKAKTVKTVEQFRAAKAPEGLDDFVLTLVSLAKQRAVGLHGSIEDRAQWIEIIDHFDLAYALDEDADEGVTVEDGIDLAIRTLRYHQRLAPMLVNFDDMIYMPIVSGIRMWQNDWVFVDEAQDTNPARRALARKMLKPGGRSVWVGDTHQAIYGFTGADADAIERIVDEFNCAILPLTTTFRCPKAVVAEAQKTVQHITAADTAPEGSVIDMEMGEFMKPDYLKTLLPSEAILCRLTKPLVHLAYSLIRQGVACHVEGREIGAGLIKLIGRWKSVKSVSALRDRLETYADRESEKLIAKGRETQAEALRDRVATIYTIMDATPPVATLDDLRNRIRALFEDTDNGGARKQTLTLSTVHKAKGREWGRVFLLGRYEFMPSKWARQAWQQEQENNLIYVAVTRAKDALVLLNGVEAAEKPQE